MIGKEENIKYGVPQGSVLGPVLFILYINDLCNIKLDGLVVTYADDTCLLFSSNTWEGVKGRAELGVNRLFNDLKNRKLSLNISKTVFIAFSIKNLLMSPVNEIKIHSCKNDFFNCFNCQKILRVNRVKYLGLFIDSSFRWDVHINILVMRLRTIIYTFYKLNKILPTDSMRSIYQALYKSVFQYGLIVWGGCSSYVLRPIEIQQNLIVRICLDKKDLQGSTTQNYKQLKVLPVKLLYKQFAILFSTSKISNKNDTKRDIRAYDIAVWYTKKEFGKHFVDYLGPTMFNSLSLNVKKCIYDNFNKVQGYIYNKKIVFAYLLEQLQ